MSLIDDDRLEELQADLEGTCKSLSQLIEESDLDIDEDTMEDRLLDGTSPVERCGGCEWWFRSTDLEFDEDRYISLCAECEED
ncbi:hypothetical protein KUV57_12755 [Epibacterium sp. DP7N7-1]|nr:hypothetical protein [Epibacterium sp. DP7N7-1]